MAVPSPPLSRNWWFSKCVLSNPWLPKGQGCVWVEVGVSTKAVLFMSVLLIPFSQKTVLGNRVLALNV